MTREEQLASLRALAGKKPTVPTEKDSVTFANFLGRLAGGVVSTVSHATTDVQIGYLEARLESEKTGEPKCSGSATSTSAQ